MNYLLQYKKLIKSARIRQLFNTPPCYTEEHHIVPDCLGGSDNSYNFVTLTAREHFVAHRLLAKATQQIYGETHNNTIKMVYSARQFLYRKADICAEYRITSRTYEVLKLEYSQTQKRLFSKKENHPMFGKTHSAASKKRMSEAKLGNTPWNKGIICGPQRAESIVKRAKSNSKPRGKYNCPNHKNRYKYELIKIDGTVEHFDGLLLFCRRNPQYNATSLGRIVNGTQKTHKDILTIRKI
jgi:hypothetical protein